MLLINTNSIDLYNDMAIIQDCCTFNRNANDPYNDNSNETDNVSGKNLAC